MHCIMLLHSTNKYAKEETMVILGADVLGETKNADKRKIYWIHSQQSRELTLNLIRDPPAIKMPFPKHGAVTPGSAE